jgi:ribosomal protein S18 acetylase RimI-like enzyme
MTEARRQDTYNVPFFDGAEPLKVECLTDPGQVTSNDAINLLNLLHRAHTDQFEDESWDIPYGAFAMKYNPYDKDQVESTQDAIAQDLHDGGHYLYLPEGGDGEAQPATNWLGVCAITPSKATKLQKLGISLPNAYVKSLFIDPSCQNTKRGSLLLLRALREASIDPLGSVTLDAYDKNTKAMKWYRDLGLVPTDTLVRGLKLKEGVSLAKTRLTSANIIGAEALASTLEQKVFDYTNVTGVRVITQPS